MTTLQNTNNLLSSFLLKGVETLIPSSDIATNKSNDKVNCNNSHNCIASAIYFISGLYYALLRYVNQYIYHTAKLFCFVGRRREYNTQKWGIPTARLGTSFEPPRYISKTNTKRGI